MDHDELVGLVRDLAERLDRLESASTGAPPSTEIGHDPATAVGDVNVDPTADEATATYAGTGSFANRTVAWKITRTWDDILDHAGTDASAVFAALANPTRIRIISQLLTGDLTTATLAERLDQPSTGQLFHHLKELLAAGIIHQPERATYSIHHHHVVPLLTLLSATTDLHPQHPTPE